VIKLILGRLLLNFNFRFPSSQGRLEGVRVHEYTFPIHLAKWTLGCKLVQDFEVPFSKIDGVAHYFRCTFVH